MENKLKTKRIKIGNIKKRKKHIYYYDVDWEKASKVFQKIPHQFSSKSKYPRVKDVLHVLAIAGGIGLIFAFPGAAPGVASLILGENSYDRWRTKNIINQMKRRKLVVVEENNDGSTTVKITKNGLTKALTYSLEQMAISKPKKWDGKWRVVIFDIAEKYRRMRDLFRMRLKQLGLTQLQESVYVSPYPCFDEIEFLRQLYRVSFKVRYLLVEKIEEDGYLRDHFSLS